MTKFCPAATLALDSDPRFEILFLCMHPNALSSMSGCDRGLRGNTKHRAANPNEVQCTVLSHVPNVVPFAGGHSDLGDRNWRHHHRHRQVSQGAKPQHRDRGCGAEGEQHPIWGHSRAPQDPGHRCWLRARHSRHFYLQRGHPGTQQCSHAMHLST